MKMRLADYVADFLVLHGITHCFTVTGGGAMHLNDALGHKAGLHCTYHHHEQAAAMAAEAFARLQNRPAAVCVTSGPGGTNAMTGVLGAYLDSHPMLVLSGQVRYDTTARGMGLSLRAGGDQEFDVTRAAAHMTKFSAMVEDACQIRYLLEKALHLAVSGRPGPCWLDIPVDVQGSTVDPDALPVYDPAEDADTLPPPVTDRTIERVIERLRTAKRPVLYAGSGVRTSGGYEIFRLLTEQLNIPVVLTWNGVDLLPADHPLYVGKGGSMGDRPGNFAVQNADLVLAVGNRLSIRQVGYAHRYWAREAFVIMVDADANELKKPTLHVELPIHADALEFLTRLSAALENTPPLPTTDEWQARCRLWRQRYPVILPRHLAPATPANVYAFMHTVSDLISAEGIIVAGNGSACVVGSQAFSIRGKQRFLINSGAASMGWDLPAAIGACCAVGKHEVICITGEGSLQMNLQELQTILTNRLPVKIFVIDNGGYHSIRLTQQGVFPESARVGIGPESGDLSFPDLKKLACAYGYPYFSCSANEALADTCKRALTQKGPVMVQIFVDFNQAFEPKSAVKKRPDGSLYSPPLEDLAPFLPREELAENMLIPLIAEEQS